MKCVNEVIICGESNLRLFFPPAALAAAEEKLMMEFKHFLDIRISHLKLCMKTSPRDFENALISVI